MGLRRVADPALCALIRPTAWPFDSGAARLRSGRTGVLVALKTNGTSSVRTERSEAESKDVQVVAGGGSGAVRLDPPYGLALRLRRCAPTLRANGVLVALRVNGVGSARANGTSSVRPERSEAESKDVQASVGGGSGALRLDPPYGLRVKGFPRLVPDLGDRLAGCAPCVTRFAACGPGYAGCLLPGEGAGYSDGGLRAAKSMVFGVHSVLHSGTCAHFLWQFS
jgi:hypothetical protein